TVGSAFPVREGALIKDPNGTAPWIMISDGMKHQFLSNAFFSYMGYTTAMLLSASSADFGAIPSGTSIPASTAPVNPAITGAAIQLPFQTSTSFVVGWTASDGGNGVKSYDVQWRRDYYTGAGSAWFTWKSGVTGTSATFVGRPGYGYCLEVRARDNANNVSLWSPERCTSIPVNDRSLTASSGWSRRTDSHYYLGTFTYTRTQGATLTLSGVDLKRLSLVATMCSTCGVVDVIAGSTLQRRVYLYSSTPRYRVVIPVRFYSEPRGAFKITIRVVSSGKDIRIEGLGASVF
ncbi:MAG: fibronectin type III domain-containing protein, partial [Actinomycetota bacterium]